MRNYLFALLVVFLAVSIGFSNDYSFTITGELPVSKLNVPSDFFHSTGGFGFQPKKRGLDLKTAPPIVTLSLTPPEKQSEIVYAPTKSIILIDVLDPPPDKLEEERIFFNQNRLILFYKPIKFTLNEQRTGGIAVSLINRKELEIPEISYNSKSRTYQIPAPPKTETVLLEEDRIYLLEDGIGFNPLKESENEQTRISLGTVDLKEFRFGFSNPFLDALISNKTNRLFFKNESLFIGAEASLDQITALASLPGFAFKMHLLDDTFVLRMVTEYERLPSFDFGLALINTTPLPVINWYTTGSNNLFSLGIDVFSQSSYGLGIRLKNDPFLIQGATGFDFSNNAFHAVIDGKYTFNRGLFNASLSYNLSLIHI